MAVTETNTWCSLVREECPSLCSGGWFSCPRWKKEEPRAFSPINHWYLACHLWPGARVGWVSQTSSRSYLIWCPRHVICAKAPRKFEGKKSLVCNCSKVFYPCTTYCNLVWCKNTLVKTIYSFRRILASSKIQSWELVLYVTACSLWVHVRQQACISWKTWGTEKRTPRFIMRHWFVHYIMNYSSISLLKDNIS